MAVGVNSRSGTRSWRLLVVCLMALGLAEGAIDLWHPGKVLTVVFALAYGIVVAFLVLWGARVPHRAAGGQMRMMSSHTVLVVASLLTAFLAYVVLEAYPLSGDEFGYTYLAETLRHGRLWNSSFPIDLQDVFRTIYVPDQEGKRLSQYAPGWPVVLSLFPNVRSAAVANTVLGLFSGILLLLSLHELQVQKAIRVAMMLIFLLAPFTVFNNASFFNHTLSGTGLLAAAYLDLRYRRTGLLWCQAGIGLAFSVLLTTRYEVFTVAFGLYVLEGLLRQRIRFLAPSMIAAAGALPVVACFAYYNWRITGSPLTTTLAWGAPNITYGLHATGMDGVNTPAKTVERTGRFITWWAEFAGFAILPFFLQGLWSRLANRSVFWFELMLPATVLFFLFYPDGGGFQFGPRYWFAGWVMLPLALAARFADGRSWSLFRWTFDPVRLAVLQTAAYVGFIAAYSVFAHLQVEARTEQLRVAATAAPPALVLFADHDLRYVSWQQRTIELTATDQTRNGTDGLGPVAFGLDLGEARTRTLCDQIHDRKIWRLRLQGAPPSGSLEPAC